MQAPDECYRCGYALLGIDDQQPCPECGLLARRSRGVSDELHNTRPRWLRRISLGANLILLAILLGGTWQFFLIPYVYWVVQFWFDRTGWFGSRVNYGELIPAFGFAFPACIFLGGAWLVSFREGYPPADTADCRLRHWLRLMALVIATHVAGRLPTLIATQTTVGLLATIVRELHNDEYDCDALLRDHDGNVRNAPRSLYARFAAGPDGTPRDRGDQDDGRRPQTPSPNADGAFALARPAANVRKNPPPRTCERDATLRRSHSSSRPNAAWRPLPKPRPSLLVPRQAALVSLRPGRVSRRSGIVSQRPGHDAQRSGHDAQRSGHDAQRSGHDARPPFPDARWARS